MIKLNERIKTAKQFIADVDLPPVSGFDRSGGSLISKLKPVNAEQSLAVGHGVVSFLPDLPSRHREAMVNSFLLAQLAADKRASAHQNLDQWYLAFFDALTKVGWLVQEQGFNEYSKWGAGVETHQAILDIASTLLGSTSAGYQVVKSTLEGLSKLSQDDWIIVFRKEDQVGTGDHFQIAVAEPNQEGDVSISLMAFQLYARSTRTQVVFFKWDNAETNLRHATGKALYADSVAKHIRDLVAEKVRSYTKDYVTNLEI